MEQKGLKAVMFVALVVMLSLVVAGLFTVLKLVPEYAQSYRLISQGLPFITRACLKLSALANKFVIPVVSILLAAI